MKPQPPTPPEDTKDWASVITDGCAQCGFVAPEPADIATRIQAARPLWREALRRPDAEERPEPLVWSPTEYACHVRDVCKVFTGRLHAMVAVDGARFGAWNGDAIAIHDRYDAQHARLVADELDWALAAAAARFDTLVREQWGRRGFRSDGRAFTIATLGVYLVHEIEHHAHDVGAGARTE